MKKARREETADERAKREIEEYKKKQAEEEKKLTERFHQCCYTGEIDLIYECIKENVSIDASDKRGHTGLFHAIASGKPSNVDLLLNEGAEIEWVDKEGASMLLLPQIPL